MPRWTPAVLVACALCLTAQDRKEQPEPQPQTELKRERPRPPEEGPYAVPPEEDDSIAPEKYPFNPLQSERDVRVGDYYFKQRNYRAAAGRYREATRWNEKNGRAWLRLGEAAGKMKDDDAAREAFAKYLEVAPDEKEARDVRKKLDKLNSQAAAKRP